MRHGWAREAEVPAARAAVGCGRMPSRESCKRLGAQPLESSQKCLWGIILNKGWRLGMAAVL